MPSRAQRTQNAPTSLEEIMERIGDVLPTIFDQAQSSVASHQKNRVALQKLHDSASQHASDAEKAFTSTFFDMLNRVLAVKKGGGGAVAERVIKFIAGYIKHLNEKQTGEAFVARVLNHLVKGFIAKDKTVRYRCTQLVTECIAFVGEIDESVYDNLHTGLVGRLADKESSVRVQVVLALSKLAASDESGEIIAALVDTVQFDPSPDVRRVAVVNLPLTPKTLPALLTRLRDQDIPTRRTLYSHVLTRLKPRHLSPDNIASIVHSGVNDRDGPVRTAAKALVAAWVPEPTADTPVLGLLTDFVALFDLAGDLEPVEHALRAVFESRRDLFDHLEFGDTYWTGLSPERALLARIFVDHCVRTHDDAQLEALPVVTALAFRVQDAFNELTALAEDALLDAAERDEGAALRAFIIGEMLRMAASLDYADEIGRRKMFGLVRDMLSQDTLPDMLVPKCLDVLRVLTPSERDLIRIVVEIVHELRDPTEDDDIEGIDEGNTTLDTASQASMTPTRGRAKRAAAPAKKPDAEMTGEEKARLLALDVRCLSLCIGMLERVNGTFEENSTLEGILADLIIPAVKRKETLLRERGLVALGLCCLIAKRMALNSFQLFMGQIQSAPDALKVSVLRTVFDIMMVHETEFLGARSVVGEDRMVEFLLHTLESADAPEVQAVVCVGLSKLMLSGMISDERVLKSLVLSYVSPQTVGNQELRQCLAYFLPVYCFSAPLNQRRMQQIVVPMLGVLTQIRADLDEDTDMVPQAQIADLFVDWTNPENLIDVPGQILDESVQIDLAIDVAKALFDDALDRDERKVLAQMLGKLFIPNEIDDDKLRTLVLLLTTLQRRRPLPDASAKTTVERLEKGLAKKFAEQLAGFNEDEYRQLAQLAELFAFLDAVVDDDEDAGGAGAQRKRRARSKSVAPDEVYELVTPKRRAAAKGRKRRGQSESDDDDDGHTGSRATSVARTPSPTPGRARLPRSVKKPKALVEADSDEDDEEEEEEEDEEEEPMPKVQKSKGRARSPCIAPTEQEEDAEDEEDIEELLGGSEDSAASASESVDEEDADGGATSEDEDDATPKPKSRTSNGKKTAAPVSKRKERADAPARTPNNRSSKKRRTNSPVSKQAPVTPMKRSEAAKRVRSEVAAGTPSPPRKKLKEVTNGTAKQPTKRSRSRPPAGAIERKTRASRVQAATEDAETSDDLNVL